MNSKFDKALKTAYDSLITEAATMKKKKGYENVKDFLADLENKHPDFTEFSLHGNEEKFMKDYLSSKYQWKFKVFSDIDKHTDQGEKNLDKLEAFKDKMKKDGWIIYDEEENNDAVAVIFQKKK